MPRLKRVGQLEVSEDIDYQEKEWKVERIGWVMIVVLILFALLGLFGGGPISTVTQSGVRGFSLTYERFDRQMNPSKLILEIPGEGVNQGEVKFWVDREYLKKVQVEVISPNPDGVELAPQRIIYTVTVAESDQPVVVVFEIQVEESGLRRGEVGLDGGESIKFTQFVFP